MLFGCDLQNYQDYQDLINDKEPKIPNEPQISLEEAYGSLRIEIADNNLSPPTKQDVDQAHRKLIDGINYNLFEAQEQARREYFQAIVQNYRNPPSYVTYQIDRYEDEIKFLDSCKKTIYTNQGWDKTFH